MSPSRKILVVDDEEDHILLIERSLTNTSKSISIEYRTSLKMALDIIPVYTPDIILSDFKLPDGDAREIITRYATAIPIIVMTSFANESQAVELIKAGAIDYFLKSPESFANIGWIIERAWREWSHIIKHRKSEEDRRLLAELLEMAPASFVVHDETGNLLYANQKTFENSNKDSKSNLIAMQDPFLREVLKGLNKSEHRAEVNFEFDFERNNGSMVPLNVYSRTISWNNRKYVLSVTTDITDIKKYQKEILDKNKEIEIQNQEYRKLTDELIKAKEKAEESDRLKSAFLANMSHEIRTPMNGIIGFADLLEENSLEEEKKKQFLQIIKNSGMQLLNIINDIIDISKIETGQIRFSEEKVLLNELLQEVYSFFKPITDKKGLDLIMNTEIAKVPNELITDGVKLRQILTNLINNAIKFTAKGQIKITNYQQDNFIHFEVHDSGCGISKENQSVIFERFRQIDLDEGLIQVGTGLGLAICKAYIELIGGNIAVYSQLGTGSTFTFSWPFKIESQKADILQSPLHNGSTYNWHGKTILIAEDELVNFFYIHEIISPTGANIVKAVNGREVLEYINRNAMPHIILMDLKMPVLNGFDTTSEIRKIDKKVPIIAVTAYAFAGEKEKAFQSGCNMFVHKPFKKEEILKSISQLI
jgi:PAS domain S-box-containing protein